CDPPSQCKSHWKPPAKSKSPSPAPLERIERFLLPLGRRCRMRVARSAPCPSPAALTRATSPEVGEVERKDAVRPRSQLAPSRRPVPSLEGVGHVRASSFLLRPSP